MAITTPHHHVFWTEPGVRSDWLPEHLGEMGAQGYHVVSVAPDYARMTGTLPPTIWVMVKPDA